MEILARSEFSDYYSHLVDLEFLLLNFFCQISVFVIPSESFETQENSIRSQNSTGFFSHVE